MGLAPFSMELTHFNDAGRAHMVDVTGKPDTERVAIARGEVVMRPETLALIREGRVAKGDVLAVAQVAGIMAAKRTAELIPMCHPLSLTSVDLAFELVEPAAEAPSPRKVIPLHADASPGLAAGEARVLMTATVKTTGKTGVEMEALTAVAVAGLTIYDMCKAVDRAMRLERVRLVRKSGGKSGLIALEEAA
jgi:cyclic pyranopterin phosphate synthase